MQEIKAKIDAASSLSELEAVRLELFGKKGIVTALFSELKSAAPEQKKELAVSANEKRDYFGELIAAKRASLEVAEQKEAMKNEASDVTLFNENVSCGALHPVMETMDKIIDYFIAQNFSVESGPLIEDDFHNFEALNLPKYHPARDMQDTFFVEKNPDILLRTHTSSVQVRVMTSQKPPIRVLCPGRVYRNEAISYRAHCFFHQIEGLYVDRNVSFADLKQALLYFAKEIFGEKTNIRLRPSYFPFTEPSAEMDISCNICGGKGCPFCKYTGWVEILGCGMVDPNVLEACGIDSKEFSGYAFGMGVERITNLKYSIKDLRLFSENDVRFLKQFV